MGKNRLEAFSDGVLAIIITIMVLELKVPHGDTVDALLDLWPVFLSYVLSFLYVGIYWNNHHHLIHAAKSVSGSILWANMHLLFWLSLLPFTTGWMGENHFTRLPMAVYGFNLLMAALAYFILQLRLAATHGPDSAIAQALGRDIKGKSSLAIYVVGTAATWFVHPWLGFGAYVLVALIWLIPDRRMEIAIQHQPHMH